MGEILILLLGDRKQQGEIAEQSETTVPSCSFGVSAKEIKTSDPSV